MSKILFIIDPQNDFMDADNSINLPAGSLAVPGASEDMKRLSNHILANPASIDSIVVTLDTHSEYDIAHQAWWQNAPAWSEITHQDVVSGKYKPVDPKNLPWALEYTKALLEQGGSYTLRVWPTHVIEGSFGHQVHPTLQEALNSWQNSTGKKVKYVKKGMNPKTESYSVFKAEVPISDDPETQLKKDLIDYVNTFDEVEFAGEALSHCVKSSVLDYISYTAKEKLTSASLLTNCMSSVTGFEAQGKEFVDLCADKGIVLKSATVKNKLSV